MFNITGGELIIVLILALVVLGPDKLPDFIRRAGRVYGEIKRMSTGFRTEFRDAIDEPVREMQDTMNVAKSWFDEGIAEVKDLGDGIRTAADFTASDDDPNFYDESGRMITAAPPVPSTPQVPTGEVDDEEPVPGGGFEANILEDDSVVEVEDHQGATSDAFGAPVERRSPERPEDVTGSVDAFGGLTPRPHAGGSAT